MNTNLLTGYAATKIVNVRLTEHSLKTIPAQMIYQYMSKNMIATVTVSGSKYIERDVFDAWCEKYIGKKLSKVTN